MNVTKKQITYNKSQRKTAIKYIVIHDTGNKSNGANAMSHFNYFNGGNRNSSADFFVDSTQILQANDYNKYYTWHCGDGGGKYGITNANSIGVEICINSDGDYDKAVKNAVNVVKQLMKELNIPVENVVRHYDASRKNCPASMSDNNWELWKDFQKEIVKSEELGMEQYEEIKKEIQALKDENKSLKEVIGTIYKTVDEIPDYYKSEIQPMIDKGVIKGTSENNLSLPEIVVRTLVFIIRDKNA